jgi:heme/copper-type cytochrome/quinol oxidase subunit 1
MVTMRVVLYAAIGAVTFTAAGLFLFYPSFEGMARFNVLTMSLSSFGCPGAIVGAIVGTANVIVSAIRERGGSSADDQL